jgi:hypothetical protein
MQSICRSRTVSSHKTEITVGRACAKDGKPKYTQDGSGWSDVWKPGKRWLDAVKEDISDVEMEGLGGESTG